MEDGSATAVRAPIRAETVKTSELRTIAFCLYAAIIIWILQLGFRYWSASQFMPYHGEALRMGWQDVPANLKVLLVALINFVGTGIVCLGWTLSVVLCVSFRRRERWADWTIATALLVFSGSGYWLTHRVATQTGAHTPWRVLGILFVSSVAATLLCLLDRIRTRPTVLPK